MKMKRALQVGFCALVITLPFAAFAGMSSVQEQLQGLANTYLKNHHDKEHISAVSLTLAQGNQTSNAVAGTTAYDNQKAVSEANLFSIGSITKSFISTIILQLETDITYHFNINDPIEKYFPEYDRWHKVTVRQLMNMTSGIPDYTSDMSFMLQFIANPYAEWQPSRLVDIVRDKELEFEPGEAWVYSNTNYILLGMIIERVTGHSLADEVNTRILIPYGLNETHYVAHQPKDDVKALMVREYMNMDSLSFGIPLGTDVRGFTFSSAAAAGGMLSTARDIAKWTQKLFKRGDVLTAKQYKKFTSLVSVLFNSGQPLDDVSVANPVAYGLGFFKVYDSEIDAPVFMYEATSLGGRASYIYNPKNQRTVVMLLNSTVDNVSDSEDLLHDTYALLSKSKPAHHQSPRFHPQHVV